MKEKLKMFNKDILIKPSDDPTDSSPIVLIEKDARQNQMNWFEVIEVSPKVTEVKVGDKVLVEFAQHTVPFIWENERYAVTSEDDVVAVLS